MTDRGNNRIQKFDTNGNFSAAWESYGQGDGQFSNPHGVTVDFEGNVYVTDSGNHRVQRFDSNGEFITKWGSEGSGNGQFYFPIGVAADLSGNVYVADNDDQSAHIQKFDSSGNFITQWGSLGAGDGQFKRPLAVAVDQAGDVYVADLHNHRIQKFDTDGNFITKWGSSATTYDPHGVATNSFGEVYIIDMLHAFPSINEPPEILYSRIQKFDSSGNLITKWDLQDAEEDWPLSIYGGIAVDPLINVYITDYSKNHVQKFDPNGNVVAEWGTTGTEGGQFRNPIGLAVDPSGNVYVVDTGNHRIQKFTPSPIHLRTPVNGTALNVNACSLNSLPNPSWSAREPFKDYEVQFSAKEDFSSVSLTLKASAKMTELNISDPLWKKIFSIADASGGTVYWRVAGTRKDKTEYVSETHAIIVESPLAAGNPAILETGKGSLPTLSWQDNCNTRFKVWFGSDEGFTGKVSFSFSDKDPGEGEGFQRGLKATQWKRIRDLVGDQTGATIYWYVESWDGLKRHSRTDVKGFVLMD